MFRDKALEVSKLEKEEEEEEEGEGEEEEEEEGEVGKMGGDQKG